MENENKNVLIIPVDLFTANQPIYFVEGNKEPPEFLKYASIDNLADTIDFYCASMKIDKVHFFGSEEFLIPAITKLKSTFKNSIEIEVN